ncbi:MAG: hypothetical protein Unbinned579contig1003_43 [Prokaryotic dsDNA virus sp.]|nr:MAG: hypothetical protein Unbinned579contig1003_43 [Prokaryotic dsDNA virus sp.]|tara:strand:+ start:10685 stop:10843 length:159 start_codon:yes stop_codon:yes gene_type:complete
MKKRKLNSKNPKYKKEKTEENKAKKKLVGEVKGAKIYTVVYDNGTTVYSKKP